MTLRRSTRVWLLVAGVSCLAILIDGSTNRLGGFGTLFTLVFTTAATVLVWRAAMAAFRVVVRRLALRLAFSYFLIGVLPIPLLAALFATFGYLLCHQLIATRLRAEVSTLAELTRASRAAAPSVRIGTDGRVAASDVAWLAAGDDASWATALAEPHPIIAEDRVWIGVRGETNDGARVWLIPIQDRKGPWLQHVADRTGYAVAVAIGTGERTTGGYQIRVSKKGTPARDPDAVLGFVEPQPSVAGPRSLWSREWLAGVYVDRAVAVIGPTAEERPIVAFLARTSPAVLVQQVFAQGIPEVSRIVRVVLVAVAAALLFVYLVALGIAFGLVVGIVRNVNRLTRATQAVSRGDFAVRVHSKSRDQIGDLARSFDDMADNIQKLLQQTALKEKLEAELAVARAVQESFLPESAGNWNGFQAVAHFEPVADLGGDYYDILPLSDSRTSVLIGDVSGHGLPTGLLAAAARATLESLLDLGVAPSDAFRRLGARARRSRESQRRLYTTAALFTYDAKGRMGTLTNAGHPAPYRISDRKVDRIALPSLPIGLLPERETGYPSKSCPFAPGDRLVLFTDGLVEAANSNEEPWGYERFEALLAREGMRPAQELIASVLAAVAAHVGATPLEDDRTIVILSFDAA